MNKISPERKPVRTKTYYAPLHRNRVSFWWDFVPTGWYQTHSGRVNKK